MLFLVRARQSGPQHHSVLPARKIDGLPGAPIFGQVGNRYAKVDDDGEQLLVQRERQPVLPHAPAGGEPIRGGEEDDCLAAVGQFMELSLPPLARSDAAIGVEIEEDVVPAFPREPIAKRHRLVIVPAGMANEDLRH